MGKKSQKHTKRKIDDKWAGMLIDMTVGSQLMLLMQRDQEGTRELVVRMLDRVKEMAGDLEEAKPADLVTTLSSEVMQMYNHHCGTKLIHCLQHGVKVPGPKKIITMDEILKNKRPH